MINTTRFRLLIIVFYFVIFCLFTRIFYMTVVKASFYQEKSKNQLTKSINIYPQRGSIYDRNHHPLAISKTCYSICAFTTHVKEKQKFITQAAPILGVTEAYLSQKLYGKYPFVWIKRQVSPTTYAQLKALKIKGIEFLKENQRVYPNGNLAAHVLGFVGIDNQGLGGLEYRYDSLLKGSAGKICLESDPKGHRMISGYKKTLDNAYDGGDITTTLEEYVQYIVQKHLKKGVEQNWALGGVAIVMDPQNGDILAMTSMPEFNPNELNKTDPATLKNTGIVDVYEPGSVFKLITMSAVLEENLANPNEVIYVPETIEVGGKKIKEAHPREHGETDHRTVSEILEKSLNVGTTLLAKRLGPKKFYSYIDKFRFGKKTGIELPGESKGLLRKASTWSGSDIGTISFGQGVAVTPIQMIAGVAAIANGGDWVKPRIIDRITYHNNQAIKGSPTVKYPGIIRKETAKKVIDMMVKTVETGTGETAKIPGYWICGKTGTAQKPNINGLGYIPGRYIASFIGFFPAYAPKYVILVVVDTPRKSIYGSSVAGPIFKNIAQDLIVYRNIPPDH